MSGAVLALDLHRHQRRRGLADRAALAGEFHVLDATIRAKLHVQVNLVAARGVVTVHMHRALGDLPEIPRPARMVEDHLLIKLFEFRVHAKKRTALSRISIMRSISSIVL